SRRGQPTVHAKWDDDTALLSGDLLMGLSYDLLARSETADLSALMTAYHRMVTRLCEGQALDTAFETRDGVSVDDYVGMIDRKTAALLQCALELGALLGGASEADRERLREVGLQAGRAFQIQDDLLDLVAEDEREIVKHLHGQGRRQRPLDGHAVRFGGEQHQHGPEALAPAPQDVADRLVQAGRLLLLNERFERFIDAPAELLHASGAVRLGSRDAIHTITD
ncbi:MAG: hypothetical protein BRD45_03070, partial [Bacteroidetes bacterium QS_8_64_10]